MNKPSINLTKSALVETAVAYVAIERPQAEAIIEDFFGHIRSCLAQGDEVRISGFGNFELRDKPERPGRNPRTGEVIPVSPRRVVTFKPGSKLKNRVQKGMYPEKGK